MFQGYLSFGGTEFANVARTLAYAHNLAPQLGMHDGYDSEGLPGVLGDAPYRSPALDPAPWYSPNRPASGGFYGFYPLKVTGLEDSTVTSATTELTGDGAVSSLPRNQSLEFRVQGLLIAENEQSLGYGRSWLQGILAGSDCKEDDCGGDAFCYLAWLPKYCDYSQFPTVALAESTETVQGGWDGYFGGTLAESSDGLVVTMGDAQEGAQRRVSGLIPGQAYRVEVDARSDDALRLEVAGIAHITARRDDVRYANGQTPWVLDFVAPSQHATIRLVSAAQGGPSTAHIYSLTVRRTPQRLLRSLPRFRSSDTREPGSWTFDPLASFIGSGATEPLGTGIESMRLGWLNIEETTQTIPANSGATRIIRGLVPGLSYVTVMRAAFSDSQIPALDVQGAADVVVTSLGEDWYRMNFVANSPQHLLRIAVPADTNVNSEESLDLTIRYLRTDLNDAEMALPEPDQAEAAMRTLYEVIMLDPLTVIGDLPMDEGAMQSVEFTMRALHPFTYSPERDVDTSPSATVSIVPEVGCSEGYPIRTNLFTNPRFNATSPGTEPQGGVGVYEPFIYNDLSVTPTVGAPGGVFDARSLNLEAIGADNSNTLVFVPVPLGSAFEIGHTYTISARVGIAAAQTGVQHQYARRIVVRTTAGEYVSNAHPNVPGYSHVSVTFTFTEGFMYIALYHGGVAGDSDVEWSYILVEEATSMGDFFDGDSPDALWVGTANQATSLWIKSGASLIVDPDCPPIPDPPQVPSIESACPVDVNVWRRYFTEIPASEASGGKGASPIIRLTTMDSEVRHVRVRFYADPFGYGVDQLNPCDYCGEFFISYIPSNTTMTIDGVLHRATADVAGTGVQNVMNLLSAFDGGPVDWPELACGTEYIMAVDVAPEEVLDLDVQLAIAQKE